MFSPLAEEELTVHWQLANPPIQASSWKSWAENEAGPLHPLEAELSWPIGTLSILENAFKQNLPRSRGWDLSGLTVDAKAAFTQAASVFRRGVPLRDAGADVPTFSTEGHYGIRLTSAWDPKDLFPEGGLVFVDDRAAEAWKIPEAAHIVPIHIDEARKTLTTVAKILKLADERGQNYSAPWSIVGGGILADTAAFAASLIKKPFRLVPTTLLAMLDACIGGKTGVNFPPFGKNQLGHFAFPEEVMISTAWLRTLPQREFLAGLNEGYKHALLIGDASLGRAVVKLDQRPEDLRMHLARLVQVKAQIVAKDPSEQGIRVALNLGHTLAHALERVSHANRSDFPLLHGEAVGVGLLFCLELSHALSYLPHSVYQTMRNQLLSSRLVIKPRQLLKHLGFGDLVHDVLIEELLIGIKQDKKSRSQDGSEWVLLRNWGELVEESGRFTVSIFDDDFRTFYRRFVENWLKA